MRDGANITCWKCGYRISPGSRVCGNCGHRIDGVCVSCGHENEPWARFCNSCEAGLNREAGSAPTLAAPGALHRAPPDTRRGKHGLRDGANITCRKCGYRISPGSRVCGNCGHRIDGVCVSCGHKNKPWARFCNSCEAGLNREAGSAPPESAPGALHRAPPDTRRGKHGLRDGADITCRKCGRRNSLDSRFCGNCGHRIDGVCVSCGHENEPWARFCNSCGAGLNGEPRQVPPESASGAPASGTSLCPRCLRQNEPGSQFCYYCGLPLEGEAARAAPPVIEAFEHGEPGGFWVRVVAVIIDSIVLIGFILLINVLFVVNIAPPDSDGDPSGVATLVNLILYFLYSPVLISKWGTTIGKRALNLYVVRNDGGRCDFWRALGRTCAMILSGLPFGIGYLMVAFREDKRGLHDLIAGTAVIRR